MDLRPLLLSVALLLPTAACADQLSLGLDATRVAPVSGGGATVDWLHDDGGSARWDLGLTYQRIGSSHWHFGTVGSAWVGTAPPARRWTASASASVGTGRTEGRTFDYQDISASLSRGLAAALTVSARDRQIDVDTAHGNMPAVSLEFVGGTRWLARAEFEKSVSGNLGARIAMLRLDHLARRLGASVGVGVGRVVPVVAIVPSIAPTPVNPPVQTLHDAFIGLAWQLGGSKILATLDHLRLGSEVHWTLTLNYAIRVTRPTQ